MKKNIRKSSLTILIENIIYTLISCEQHVASDSWNFFVLIYRTERIIIQTQLHAEHRAFRNFFINTYIIYNTHNIALSVLRMTRSENIMLANRNETATDAVDDGSNGTRVDRRFRVKFVVCGRRF